jgi:hypothetical protein
MATEPPIQAEGSARSGVQKSLDEAAFLPSITAALGQSSNEISRLDPERQAEVNHKTAITEDKIADTELKKLYARRFIWILVVQLLVMSAVFIAVGLGCLKYDDSTTLQLFMGGTLAEVFGVVFVITRYLFAK